MKIETVDPVSADPYGASTEPEDVEAVKLEETEVWGNEVVGEVTVDGMEEHERGNQGSILEEIEVGKEMNASELGFAFVEKQELGKEGDRVESEVGKKERVCEVTQATVDDQALDNKVQDIEVGEKATTGEMMVATEGPEIGKGGGKPQKMKVKGKVRGKKFANKVRVVQAEEELGMEGAKLEESVEGETGNVGEVAVTAVDEPKVDGSPVGELESCDSGSPLLGKNKPTKIGAVFRKGMMVEEGTIRMLREHYVDLKRSNLLLQGISRSMKKMIVPESWRPFDSSKTWPMCIFYRNPQIDPELYRLCREDNHASYGDATTPKVDDPVWGSILQDALVTPVHNYVENHKAAFSLGDKIPFSIQALWYDKGTRKAEHKDPSAYTIISALNVQGRAELSLWDPFLKKGHDTVEIEEGSMYVLHNEAIYSYDHAVSAPMEDVEQGKRERVTLVLRFIDGSDYEKLMKILELSRVVPKKTRKRRRKKNVAKGAEKKAAGGKKRKIQAKAIVH